MTVKAPEKLKAYVNLAAQASAKHGGDVLARGGVGAGKVLSLEGFEQSRVAVTEFPSMQHAIDCFNSEEYQASLAVMDGELVL